MSTNLCAYFQIHQPRRLGRLRVFDVGSGADAASRRSAWFNEDLDRGLLERVVARCYRPALALLRGHARRHGPAFRVALGVTSTALAQLDEVAPDVIDAIGDLVAQGTAEILGETSHHSLAWLLDRDEFANQVDLHREDVRRRFGVVPEVFRNTELIYDDGLARWLASAGYRAVLVEGVDALLSGADPVRVHASAAAPSLRLLARHYRLSDDVAFRLGDAGDGRPLDANRWAQRVARAGGETVNFFLDFETFGEHRGEAALSFLAGLPEALAGAGVGMHLPREAARLSPAGFVSAPAVVSWADEERDASAWLGNAMQQAAARRLYSLLPAVRDSHDLEALEAWRCLAGSDHAYYMSTKGFSDGDVHAQFRPWESPYDAHLNFMNVVADLEACVREARPGRRRRRVPGRHVLCPPRPSPAASAEASA